MKNHLLLLILFSTTAFSGYTQKLNYNQDGRVRVLTDKTELKITPVQVYLDSGNIRSFGIIPGLTALLPPMVDFGVSAYQYLSKKSMESYSGEFTCWNSACCLWVDRRNVQLPELTITRKILLKKGDTTLAAHLVLSPELSDNNVAFRYRLAQINYPFSIAKTKGPYDFVDLDIQIALKVLSLNENQYELKDFRTSVIRVESVKVGGTFAGENIVYSGWFPLVGISVPPVRGATAMSLSDTNDIVSGVYEVEIKVTEYNPFKIRAEDKKQFFEGTKDSFSTLIKKIIEQGNPGKD